MGAEILSIQHLTKKYSQQLAVDDLSLTVDQGEVLGLLGPNGAGKSTAMNIITGLITKTSGEISLFGKKKINAAVKRKIGFVPQDIAIYEDLTAWENVLFFGGLYDLRGHQLQQLAQKALEFVGLTAKKDVKSKNFSGGMKRRLNIACALVHQPQLLIMDEPTVGVDPQSRNFILTAIEQLHQQGVTIIYCSHYMEEVERISTRVAIIDHGRLLAQGTTSELSEIVSADHQLQATLVYPQRIDLEQIKQITGIEQAKLTGRQLTVVYQTESSCSALLKYLLNQAAEVTDFNQNQLDLETIFLSLTGRKLRDE